MRTSRWFVFFVAVVVATALVGAFGASAALAVPVTNQRPLVTRSGHQVGWLTVDHKPGPNGGELWVTYQLSDDSVEADALAQQERDEEEEWRIVAIHLAVGERLCSIPTKRGEPAWWKFPWSRKLHHPDDEYTVKIPLEHTDIKNGENIYFSAQAVIQKCEECDEREREELANGTVLDQLQLDQEHEHHEHKMVKKTVWALGERFPRAHHSWGMYFKLSCGNPKP